MSPVELFESHRAFQRTSDGMVLRSVNNFTETVHLTAADLFHNFTDTDFDRAVQTQQGFGQYDALGGRWL